MLRVLLTCCVLFFCYSSLADNISIDNAWINEAPPGINVLAGYMTINNRSDESIDLLDVNSDVLENIEFHLTTIDNGVVAMHKQEIITIAANSSFSFTPGNYHLMMFNPVTSLVSGDKVMLNMDFSNGETASIEAIVKRGSEKHDHSHH